MTHTTIIAEAGVNHNGDIGIAKRMVEVAKDAGADYIKFQTFIPRNLVSKYAAKAEYQKRETGKEETQLNMLEKLTLSENEYVYLAEYCKKIGIGFLSTPFDLESIRFLEKFDMDFWKVPSGEITNLPYLSAIGRTKKKVVLSTGMSDLQEVRNAVQILEETGTKDILILHCNTQYPTLYQDVNLTAMYELKEKIGKAVGYSDHTIGIEIPIAAVAMGARIIEKHFTLDRMMSGPDHKASLEPNELKNMVNAIRNVELAFGDGKKCCSVSERENMNIARKSIVAFRRIAKGEVFTEENLTTKRPGNGISPMRWKEIIGQIAKRDFEEDELIEI